MNTKPQFRSAFVAPILVSLVWLMILPSAWSQETPKPTSEKAPAKVRFRPPTQAAPSVRLTGGSRGSGDTRLELDVLAPDDVGLTTQPQPSLFWYQSRRANAKFELTLLQENQIRPALQVFMDRPMEAGIHRLRLSDHGVTLTPGIEYQWVLAVIHDPDNRSSDLVSSGVIKRIDPPVELKRKLEQSPVVSRAAVYAETGIWYDALAALSDRIEASPEDRSLREARVDLLRQVGLTAPVDPP